MINPMTQMARLLYIAACAVSLLLLTACQPIRAPQGKSMTSASRPKPPTLTYLALGDSYTIGESVVESARWPVQLAEQLRKEGLAVADPQIIARTGWTTSDLQEAIDRERPRGPFDLVTLLIGVNNQYRGLSPLAYQEEFGRLLDEAIALAGDHPEHVIVLSIPDWGATPFAEGRNRANIAHEIDQFNAINQEVAQRAGIAYIDVTPSSRLAATERTLVADDGLHPSGKMYAAWVELVLPEALAALDRKGEP